MKVIKPSKKSPIKFSNMDSGDAVVITNAADTRFIGLIVLRVYDRWVPIGHIDNKDYDPTIYWSEAMLFECLPVDVTLNVSYKPQI